MFHVWHSSTCKSDPDGGAYGDGSVSCGHLPVRRRSFSLVSRFKDIEEMCANGGPDRQIACISRQGHERANCIKKKCSKLKVN